MLHIYGYDNVFSYVTVFSVIPTSAMCLMTVHSQQAIVIVSTVWR